MRLALIGGHGHHYLRGLLSGSDVPLEVAVAGDNHDPQAARAAVPRFTAAGRGSPRWFDSPEQLFEEFEPEVVSIGAVYGFNGDMAALALERDSAVVCDKPIAATRAQLQRLRELTQDNKRVLLTEFPVRCQSEFRAAREAVQSGQIGMVVPPCQFGDGVFADRTDAL